MSKVRLVFNGISEIVGSDDIGVIVLVDESYSRQLSIICDKPMTIMLELRKRQVPVTQVMLPEVLGRILNIQTEVNLEVLINEIVDGQYKAVLYNADTLDTEMIRVSDAVLLSVSCHVPLYISTELFKRQSVPFSDKDKGVALPLNSISFDMLKAALEKAIGEENYELASHLRDEMRKRENARNNTKSKEQ